MYEDWVLTEMNETGDHYAQRFVRRRRASLEPGTCRPQGRRYKPGRLTSQRQWRVKPPLQEIETPPVRLENVYLEKDDKGRRVQQSVVKSDHTALRLEYADASIEQSRAACGY